MLAWSPILIQKIEIQALGFVLRKLQLNRHRETEVSAHAHAYAQLILYLSGEGWQTIAGRRSRAKPGDLFQIPAGVPHGFGRQRGSLPLCLVLDYELDSPRRIAIRHRRLPTATLNELHALLARVPRKGKLRLSDYPAILAVVAKLIEPSTHPRRENGPEPALLDQVTDQMRTMPSAPPAILARKAGYHRDHLSRRLKRDTGLGLRALRDRVRLEHAQTALRSHVSIAEAAALAGFDDPNYFTRWFRQQTGSTPSRWRTVNSA